MTEQEIITEGGWHAAAISHTEADALRALGRTLASRSEWWGSTSRGEPNESTRTVIEVRRTQLDAWEVRVPGSVGVIQLGSRTFVVQPKIPTSQFVELLSLGTGMARTSSTGTYAAHGDVLWNLIEQWFLDEAQHLSAHGLLRDYVECDVPLTVARGSVDQLQTARSLLTGTLAIHCRYEDYQIDTPHNRLLRAGLAVVVRSRDDQRARIASRLMGEVRTVGTVRPLDWRAPFDRRSRIYEPVARLAKLLVSGTALALESVGISARCFLLRSAPVFEYGIREAIRQHLAGRGRVGPKGIYSTTGRVRFDPDIVIDLDDSCAIADVKYRHFERDWDSNTRNQIVAFATAARTTQAAVIGIEHTPGAIPRSFSLDELRVLPIGWQAWHDDPCSQLAAAVDEWLHTNAAEDPSRASP